MTNKEKQLLIKDLCMRLPYGVKAKSQASHLEINTIDSYFVCEDGKKMFHLSEPDFWQTVDDFQYYLRPLSSMTEEESQKELWLRGYGEPSDYVDFCLEHHLDFRKSPMGLTMIEQGLAIEAPEDMYKTE